MSTRTVPLAGLKVGISVSESDDLEARGFTPSGMNRLTVRLNDALLGAGATLVFGHDWREDGIMDAVCRSALRSAGYPEPGAPPPVLNLLPWGDSTRVDPEIRRRLHRVLDIRPGELPPELAGEASRAAGDRDLWRYLRSRGLTHLRRRLTSTCGARICLGGRESGFQGRYAGILEEAAFAFEAGQPVYLVGLLGGAAEHLGRSLLDLPEQPAVSPRPAPATRESEIPLKDLYREHNGGELLGGPLDDQSFDPEGAWAATRALGRERIGDNGLSLEENRQLIETHSEEEAIILILRGLRRRYERKENT
jgi:hypothetical protein